MTKSSLRSKWSALIPLALLVFPLCFISAVSERSINPAEGKARQRRLLYVAAPGIRSYLEHGGHGLKDEHGVDVHSEKLLEIDFNGDQPVRTGDQFGIGRVETL